MTAAQNASAPVPDIGSIWPRLRRSITDNPARALSLLINLTADDPTTSQAHRVDALTLLAETYQQLHRDTAAFHTACLAVSAAQDLCEVDTTRLLPALTVHADTSVHTGQPDAITVCEDYLRTLDDHADLAPERSYHAWALHAVAVYHHHDHHRGADLLREVLDSITDDEPWRAMLTAGLTAMHEPPGTPAAGRPCPVPGGALHPTLHEPPVTYLASRVRARPAATRAER